PPPGEAETIGGGRRNAHRCAHNFAQHLLGLGPTRCELGSVADDLHSHVADLEACCVHACDRLGQKIGAGSTLPARIVGAEVGAQVSHAARGQQGVACCMGGYVTIGMTSHTVFARPFQTGEKKRLSRKKRVDVGSDAHPRSFHHLLCDSTNAPPVVRCRGDRHRSGAATCSYGFLVGEGLFEKGLGLVLVGLFGEREFTDVYMPCLVQHSLLVGCHSALIVSATQINRYLG